jgi:hypothetical protein
VFTTTEGAALNCIGQPRYPYFYAIEVQNNAPYGLNYRWENLPPTYSDHWAVTYVPPANAPGKANSSLLLYQQYTQASCDATRYTAPFQGVTLILRCETSAWRNINAYFDANITTSSGSNSTGGSTTGSGLPPFTPTIPEPWTCDSTTYPNEFTEGTYRNQMIIVGDTRVPSRNATNASAPLDPAFLPNQAQVNLVSLCPTQ